MSSSQQNMTTRRHFLGASGASVATAAVAGAGPCSYAAPPVAAIEPTPGSARQPVTNGPIMQLAEILPPPAGQLWRLAKQCGANFAVGTWGRNPNLNVPRAQLPWSYDSLARLKETYEQEGFQLAVLECRPPTNKIKLGLPGRDDETEAVCDLIRNMGRLRISVWCYEWMPVINWLRTETAISSRGGALVTGFDRTQIKEAPITEFGDVTEDRLWASLKYFLDRVVPVAEQAGVKLAMHPDDPPLSPIRGMARIMRSVDNYQRLLDLVPSPVNGITLCQGNFTLMTDDLPGVIRRFGSQRKIFFVHFRDVRGTPEKYIETFHDDGKTDMLACMRAYRDIGYGGVCRPDHVPTMDGDSNESPGYSITGRLFALGYIRGLQQAVYAT